MGGGKRKRDNKNKNNMQRNKKIKEPISMAILVTAQHKLWYARPSDQNDGVVLAGKCTEKIIYTVRLAGLYNGEKRNNCQCVGEEMPSR